MTLPWLSTAVTKIAQHAASLDGQGLDSGIFADQFDFDLEGITAR